MPQRPSRIVPTSATHALYCLTLWGLGLQSGSRAGDGRGLIRLILLSYIATRHQRVKASVGLHDSLQPRERASVQETLRTAVPYVLCSGGLRRTVGRSLESCLDCRNRPARAVHCSCHLGHSGDEALSPPMYHKLLSNGTNISLKDELAELHGKAITKCIISSNSNLCLMKSRPSAREPREAGEKNRLLSIGNPWHPYLEKGNPLAALSPHTFRFPYLTS